MPLLPESTDLEFGKTPTARIPEAANPDLGPSPDALDVIGAALRQTNTASALTHRLTSPTPDVTPTPGFDPLAHVPKGYEDHAEAFIDAQSEADMQYHMSRIDDERRDKQIIARAGGWGVAAVLASGSVDPINVAAMAIPVVGETRLGNMARLAAVGAGSGLAQDAALSQINTTGPTAKESLLNVGRAAVLSGLLGAIMPRVPRAEIGPLMDKDLGPGSGSILDDRIPVPPTPDPEALFVARQLRERIAAHEKGITDTIFGPLSEQAKGVDMAATQDALTQAIAERDRLAAGLMTDKAERVSAEAERLSGGQGVLENLRRRYNMVDVSSVIGERAEQNVAQQIAAENEQVANANSVIERLQSDVDAVNKVRAAEGDLEQLRYGMKEAEGKGLSALADVLPEAERGPWMRRIQALEQQAQHDIPSALPPTDTGLPPMMANETGANSMGAAAAAQTTLEDQRVARGARLAVEGPLGKVAPGTRLLSSPSLRVRQLLENLVNVGEVLEKNMKGIANAIPIERLLWRAEGIWQTGVDARAALYKQYRQRIAQEGGQRISRREFGIEVSKAMRRGDQHAIPEVSEAAKQTRKLVFDPYYQRALKAGLVPEEAKLFAESYLTRQYNAQAIRANRLDWHKRLREWFISQGADPAEADAIAHQATRNVTGAERGTMDWNAFKDIVPESGRLKGRTLSVPDSVLEPYLSNDIDHLTHSYLRSMAPEVEMHERFGSRDLANEIQDIKDEYAVLKQKALVDGDNELANKLDANLSHDIRDIQAIRDRLYGIHGQPKDPGSFFVRAARLLRQNNVLRLLGGATISHIPDVANVIARYGLGNTLNMVRKLATSFEASAMTRAESHRLGAALDMAMNTISVLGDFGSHSQYAEQRIAGKLTRAFTIATLETPLVTLIQNVAGVLGQHEILNTAEIIAKGGAADRNLLTRLASAGLDELMLQRIATEAAEHGQDVNGIRFGHSEIWKDQQAAQAFESAILKDAHGMTLRPSVADTPLFMSTELGKTVAQFKTFAFASLHNVINPMMQGIARGDPRAAVGLVSLITAGAASYMAKQAAAGQPIETDNPGRFALEVLDKANILGWTGEMVFPALWQMGFKDLSRWSDRDPAETFLGPSAGTVLSTLERRLPGKALATDDERATDSSLTFKRSDLHFLRRTFIPGQNLWWLRRAVNSVEDTVGDSFNLPGDSNADRAARRANQ